jgi:hypothetical protein
MNRRGEMNVLWQRWNPTNQSFYAEMGSRRVVSSYATEEAAKLRSPVPHWPKVCIVQAVHTKECLVLLPFGQHPRMELKLVNYIWKMQSMGVPLEMWMIWLVARGIFCEQNPEKYPTEAHVAVCGNDDVEYPSKLSNHWMKSFLVRHNFSYHKLATKMKKRQLLNHYLRSLTITMAHYKWSNSQK